MSVLQDLHTVGINPFAAVLVAESVLKSPLAERSKVEPLRFFMPIKRSDCPGWAGVWITVEAVSEP